ncbi:MAG: hypothetical protein JW909_08435 [Planctomycetes bacterium]|nr:hypothetical protein [Planctomycetota bacterium]
MRTFMSFRGCVAVSALLVFVSCAVPLSSAFADEQELKETKMTVGDQLVTLVLYKGRYYTKVLPAVLENQQYKNKLVCVESKFDGIESAAGGASVLRIVGSDIQFLYSQSLGPLGLIRGDNVWIGGVAEPVVGKENLRVRIRGIVKLPNDMTLFNQRFAQYSAEGDWQQLINIGDWMGKVSKMSVSSMRDMDVYERKQRQAYRKAMEVRSAGIAADDAEGFYSVAIKYLELLDDTVSAQRNLKKCLEIDPRHRAAQEKLVFFGYVLYDGRWMTRAEREFEIKKTGGVVPPQNPPSGDAPTGDTSSPDVEIQTLSPAELAAEKLRIRKAALSGDKPEIDVLLDEAGKVKAPGLAVYILRLLALRHEESALDGINSIGAIKDDSVTRTSLEILIWRPEQRALDNFVAGLQALDNGDVFNHGFDLLVAADKKRSLPVLINLLDSDSEAARMEARLRLKKLTGERFDKVSDWRSWYQANPD